MTKDSALELPSVMNHLTIAAVVKPRTTASFSHVHLLGALTIPMQDVSMSSVEDAAVYLGSLCGVQKLLTSVTDSQNCMDI